MKKVLLLVCVVISIMLASCGYSKEDLKRAECEGYQEGFEEGYDLAKYEDRGELESIKHQMEGEIERLKSEYGDSAYEAGYDVGYEDGYADGYDDCKGGNSSFDPDNLPRIKKDK